MLCPRGRKVVQASPEGGQSAFNLVLSVSVSPASRGITAAYHQLSHHRFVEVFRPHVHALCHQESPIHMLFLHTARAFLDAGCPFFLQFAGISILFRFPPLLEGCHISVVTRADSEEGEVRPTASG